MKITNIKIENSINPIGVDEKKPFFSWEICAKENDVFQESYRITVAEDRYRHSENVWDSGIIFSDKSTDVVYKGSPLKPDTRYLVTVEVQANGKKLKKATASFTTGLLGKGFGAKWLSVSKEDCLSPETCVYVRKEFCADEVFYATLYVYSFGWYEAYIGGEKIDRRVLSPSHSNFEYLLYYDVYDVTQFIKDGNNTIALMIGDGYNYNANMYMSRWRGSKKFIAKLSLHKKDGSVVNVVTDETWRFTNDTPLITNNIYNGELYDATKEINGWNKSGFDDSDWKNLYVQQRMPKISFYANIGPFVTIKELIRPQKIYKLQQGRYIFDFGQNISGYVQFSLKKSKGERIRIKTAEEITFDTKREVSLDITTNRAAASTDTYIFSGSGTETHHPFFTYHGFRYAEISGLDRKPKGSEIVACVLHTDFSDVADFKTDNELINRIYKNALWSVKTNSQSIPTDCTARDERTACPMDLYAYIKSAMYMLAPTSYYPRYLKTLVSKEFKGKIKMTWDGCTIALPWYFYRYYGNTSYIKRFYKLLKVFQDKYLSQYPDLVPQPAFGDWCAPNKQGDYLTSFSSCDETEQHAMYFTCKMMSDMARIMGKKVDEEKYDEIAEKACELYIERFYDEEQHTFSGGKQAPNIFALVDGFLSDEESDKVAHNLVSSIKENGNHLDVGIYGTRHFIECLCDVGNTDTALECFMNQDYPSFAYEISKGATTLWEQWCGDGDMASHNHAMFAGAVSGFFTSLAGVRINDNGFKSILIKPCITKYINNLSTRFATISGIVEVNYEKTDKLFKLKAKIPANCKAQIVMPDGEEYKVGNGTFEFDCNL